MASAFAFDMRTLLSVVFWFCIGMHQWEWKTHAQESTLSSVKEVKLSDIVVVVLSQSHPYHQKRAELFRDHFEKQLKGLAEKDRPDLLLTHEVWPEMNGAWTIFPLAAPLAKLYGNKRWIIFCEEDTRMDVQRLPSILQQHDDIDEPFLGRGLTDAQSTIIHHYASYPPHFAYPDFTAGMALSLPLIKRLAVYFTDGSGQKIQFSIDPKHELAKYLWDNLDVRLEPVCEFCGTPTSKAKDCDCVAWQPTPFPTHCGPPIGKSELFVAVKTCSKFHEDRVPVVQNTWGKDAQLIEYYSDVENTSIPTVDLGVPNTESGHCGKTRAIIHNIARKRELASLEWLLIADDDTIINLELLRSLLSCYKSDEPVFLGERYGYAVAAGYGYNYITGGGGMVFNRAAVDLVANEFSCPSVDSPDDMILGMFFTSRGLANTHSRYFHQARPYDYSPDFLSTQIPVSFHKHWNCDPYEVYKQLVAAKLPQLSSADRHEEL
ncbi:beta-1,3-glucosyltransferase-like [Littorina saxatilis]|uniref:Fringe-like glycosyltransferase domain-containing protein n=1 Tax=Littorina saxatilis TaxID=31220 RepID=A0AAN9AJT3_9CAEN